MLTLLLVRALRRSGVAAAVPVACLAALAYAASRRVAPVLRARRARRRRATSRSTASASRSRPSPSPAPGCASARHERARSSSPSARSPPGAMPSGRPRSSTSRAASPRSASSTSRPCPRARMPVPALEAWAGEDVSSWRLELGRFYDDHARVHLRRDPGTAALLAALRADGARLAVYGQGPREASAVTLGVPRARPPAGRRRARARRRRLRGLPGGARRRRGARTSARARSSPRSACSRARRSASSSPVRAIASTWSPGRTIVSGPAMSDAPARSTAIRRAPSGSAISDTRRCATSSPSCTSTTSRPSRRSSSSGTSSWSGSSCSIRRMIDVVAHTDGRDPEQVEELVVAGIVDARDHALDAVALARDLAHDDVVLVVAGHGHDQLGALDAAALEHHAARSRRRAGRRARAPPRAGGSASADCSITVTSWRICSSSCARLRPTLPPPAMRMYIRSPPYARARSRRARRSRPRSGRPCASRARRRARRARDRARARRRSSTPYCFCAICAQTTFVLSPLVATTTASARSMPAASSVAMSSA